MQRALNGLNWPMGFLASLLFLGQAGCGALEGMLNLDKPSARVTGVSLKDINPDSATLLFDVEVKNPYSVPLPLVNMDYGLSSHDTSFLSGKAALQGTVPARGKKTISLPARISYLGLLKALANAKPGSVIPYRADLGLSVSPPAVGQLRLPLRKEGKLPIPAVPDVNISEIKWNKVTLDETGGQVKLDIVNRNQFPIKLSTLAYALSLGGVEVANGKITKAVAFEAGGGTGTVVIPISFSPKSMGLAVFRMLTGSDSEYRLQGIADVKTPFGPMSLPVEKAGKTIFRR